MRPYEVMVIFDAGTEPPAIQAVVDRTMEVISTTGGNPGSIDRWGKRPFAYEVNHKREGYYVLIEFTAGPATVAELDRHLALTDEVVRHKTIRLPEKVAGRARTAPPRSRGRDNRRPEATSEPSPAGEQPDVPAAEEASAAQAG